VTHPPIPGSARRITVPFARLARWLAGYADNHIGTTATRSADMIGLDSPDGAQVWLEVPFPPMPDTGDALADLLAHTAVPRTVGVVLVRRGGFAAGVFVGDRLTASKVGHRYVQGTTKAGGWSQQRFARRRDNQAREVFAAAADTAVSVFQDGPGLDAVVVGGDRLALEAVLADRRLAALRPLLSGPVLEVGEPRRAVLEASAAQFLAVRIALHP
jgi:hypothetical protein